MKLFVPIEGGDKNPNFTYLSIRGFIEEKGVPMADDLIFAVDYEKDGSAHRVEVGRIDPAVEELVVAIFRVATFDSYYFCSRNSGVMEGEPVEIEGRTVTAIENFEETQL